MKAVSVKEQYSPRSFIVNVTISVGIRGSGHGLNTKHSLQNIGMELKDLQRCNNSPAGKIENFTNLLFNKSTFKSVFLNHNVHQFVFRVAVLMNHFAWA